MTRRGYRSLVRSDRWSAAFHKTKLCTAYIQGVCPRSGAGCPFAHGEEELRRRPDLQRTSMCPNKLRHGFCEDPSCSYAHSEQERRSLPDEITFAGSNARHRQQRATKQDGDDAARSQAEASDTFVCADLDASSSVFPSGSLPTSSFCEPNAAIAPSASAPLACGTVQMMVPHPTPTTVPSSLEMMMQPARSWPLAATKNHQVSSNSSVPASPVPGPFEFKAWQPPFLQPAASVEMEDAEEVRAPSEATEPPEELPDLPEALPDYLIYSGKVVNDDFADAASTCCSVPASGLRSWGSDDSCSYRDDDRGIATHNRPPASHRKPIHRRSNRASTETLSSQLDIRLAQCREMWEAEDDHGDRLCVVNTFYHVGPHGAVRMSSAFRRAKSLPPTKSPPMDEDSKELEVLQEADGVDGLQSLRNQRS